jgi:hypothetical protein
MKTFCNIIKTLEAFLRKNRRKEVSSSRHPTLFLRDLYANNLSKKRLSSFICKEDLIAEDSSTFLGPHPLFAA